MSWISVLFFFVFLRSTHVHAGLSIGRAMHGAQMLKTHPLLSSIARRARETAAAKAAQHALPELSSENAEHSANTAAELARLEDLSNAQKSLAEASVAAQKVLATQAVSLVKTAVQATQASDESISNHKKLLASTKNAFNAKVDAKVDAASAAAAMEQYELLRANATEAEQRAHHWREQAEIDQKSVDEARQLYDAFQAAADQARKEAQNRRKGASNALLDIAMQMVNSSLIEATQVLIAANSTGISSQTNVAEAKHILNPAKLFDMTSNGTR